MLFLQQSYKQQPKQWGAFSSVQSNLFDVVNSIGIDPNLINYAVPGWENAGLVAHNYAKSKVDSDLSSGAIFDKDKIKCITDLDHIDTNLTIGTFGTNEAGSSTRFSFMFGYQKIIAPSSFYYFTNSSGALDSFSIIGNPSNRNLSFSVGGAAIGVGADSGVEAFNILTDGKPHIFGVTGTFGNIPNFVLDSKVYVGSTTASSLTSAVSNDVFFGGRNDSAGRHCGGLIGPIISSYENWTVNQMLSLSENFNSIWKPRIPVFYSLPEGGGSPLLPIKINDQILSFIGKKGNSGSVNATAGSGAISNSGNEGKNGIISITFDVLVSLLGAEGQVVFTGVLNSNLQDNLLSTIGQKGNFGNFDSNIDDIISLFLASKGFAGVADISVSVGSEIIGKLGIKGDLDIILEDAELKMYEIKISGRIFQILLSTKTGQITILSKSDDISITSKSGNINIGAGL